MSVGLGIGLFGTFWAILSIVPVETTGPVALVFVLEYLAVTNITLAAFNLLSGFLMDGGRVLRALLAVNRPSAQATEIAVNIDKLVAIGLGVVGLVVGVNPLLVVVVFFIYIGATSEAKQLLTQTAFKGVVVQDIMTSVEDISTVDAKKSVSALLTQMFRERYTGYPVCRDGALVGLVTLDDAKSVTDGE